MTTHLVDKQNMEALEKLAATNLLISDARNALFKMKEDEITYIAEREAKTLDHIQALFDASEEIINNTKSNYTELAELLNTVADMAKFVIAAQGNFSQLIADFEERNTLWEANVAEKEKELLELSRKVKAETVMLQSEHKNIDIARNLLAQDQRKIDDQWAEIARELKRLKK